MDSAAAIRAADVNYCVGTWNRTVIAIWRWETDARAVANMNRIIRLEQADERAGPVNTLFIVEKRSIVPDQAARKELAVFSRDLVSKMSAAAIVAEGGGFRAAMVRGVGITLTTLMPHRLPFKFVSDVVSAIAHLMPHLPGKADGATALRDALDDMRADVERRFPLPKEDW